MHLIVCIDQRDGMLFNCRRLSSDKVLTQRILQMTQGSTLWMSSYSAKLFSGFEGSIHVAEDYLACARNGAYCFAEDADLLGVKDKLESVTLFLWNRSYPADKYFSRQLLDNLHLVHTEDFPGNSHETITLERYEA